jgi:hypothetical protein
MVDIVVERAGKVRSAVVAGSKDVGLVNDSADWKFIPAFKDGHPVASRMRVALGLIR